MAGTLPPARHSIRPQNDWDGAEEPIRIHSDWKLVGTPHIFVVDRDGYIRFVAVRGDELNQAVHLLVSEQI